MTLRIGSAIESIARGLRAVLGAGDYEGYAAHVKDKHPESAALTRDEFYSQRMADRYDKPGARCC